MDGLEAIDVINSWRRILIEGKPEQIEKTLADIEKRLGEMGWERKHDIEATMNRPAKQAGRWRCFVGGPKDGPQSSVGPFPKSGVVGGLSQYGSGGAEP